MNDMVYCLIYLLFSNIPLWYFYIKLRSSIIFCISFGDIDLSLGISLPCSFVTVSKLFCCEVFETFVILLSILLPMKSPVASVVFWITFFEVFLSASIADYLAWLRNFRLNLPLKYLIIFLPILLPIFLAKDKNLYTNIRCLG